LTYLWNVTAACGELELKRDWTAKLALTEHVDVTRYADRDTIRPVEFTEEAIGTLVRQWDPSVPCGFHDLAPNAFLTFTDECGRLRKIGAVVFAAKETRCGRGRGMVFDVRLVPLSNKYQCPPKCKRVPLKNAVLNIDNSSNQSATTQIGSDGSTSQTEIGIKFTSGLSAATISATLIPILGISLTASADVKLGLDPNPAFVALNGFTNDGNNPVMGTWAFRYAPKGQSASSVVFEAIQPGFVQNGKYDLWQITISDPQTGSQRVTAKNMGPTSLIPTFTSIQTNPPWTVSGQPYQFSFQFQGTHITSVTCYGCDTSKETFSTDISLPATKGDWTVLSSTWWSSTTTTTVKIQLAGNCLESTSAITYSLTYDPQCGIMTGSFSSGIGP
jgi:hypothetical protein